MKLWNKFCNLDIIGKTCVLTLLFIAIVATITVVTRYANQEKDTIETDQQNVEQQTVAFVEESQTANNNNSLVIEENNNTVVKESETNNQYKENKEITTISVEKQNTNSKKETVTQTSNQPAEKANNATQNNQQDNKKTDTSTQKENKPVEGKKTAEQKVKLDFTKYDRYAPALNGGYTCFKKNNNEIAKLKGLIDQAVSTFDYKNVKVIQNKDIAMSTRYFTANRTNVENKVYNSEDFTIYYYAEAEYTLSSQGVENFIQYRSYITVR